MLIKIKTFLEDVKKYKTYNIISDKKDNEIPIKTSKEILSDIQTNKSKELRIPKWYLWMQNFHEM